MTPKPPSQGTMKTSERDRAMVRKFSDFIDVMDLDPREAKKLAAMFAQAREEGRREGRLEGIEQAWEIPFRLAQLMRLGGSELMPGDRLSQAAREIRALAKDGGK